MDININDENITMDDVMASIGEEQEIRKGIVIEGTIVRIDKDGIMVDIGGKSEAKIPADELSAKESANPEECFNVGDKIKARVIQPSGKEGIILSKKSLDYQQHWEDIQNLFNNKEIVKAVVKEANKGGLRVDLLGYHAFCPNSQVWGKPEKVKTIVDGQETEISSYEKLVGTTLEFEIKELDKTKNKIILSNRDVIKKQKEKEKKEFWKGIYDGQIREGVVKSIQSYGAFINLGGNFDGMLHISEMSWNKINSPKEVLKIGQTIQVFVISADQKAGRISLSLKQILPDPWPEIPAKYPLGTVFSGIITRVAQKAAFVGLENGIEGIIPISEISTTRINVCEDKVKKGDEVTVKVIEIKDEERKIVLSIRKAEPQAPKPVQTEFEEEEYIDIQQDENDGSASFNLGELLPDALKN